MRGIIHDCRQESIDRLIKIAFILRLQLSRSKIEKSIGSIHSWLSSRSASSGRIAHLFLYSSERTRYPHEWVKVQRGTKNLRSRSTLSRKYRFEGTKVLVADHHSAKSRRGRRACKKKRSSSRMCKATHERAIRSVNIDLSLSSPRTCRCFVSLYIEPGFVM